MTIRDEIATEVESIKMGEILLAAGEMTAQEKRTCMALVRWIANRIRNGNPAMTRERK